MASGEFQSLTVSIGGLIDSPQSLQINGFAEVQDPVEGAKLVLVAMASRELDEIAPVSAAATGVAAG